VPERERERENPFLLMPMLENNFKLSHAWNEIMSFYQFNVRKTENVCYCCIRAFKSFSVANTLYEKRTVCSLAE
jgi:hypothetical protein